MTTAPGARRTRRRLGERAGLVAWSYPWATRVLVSVMAACLVSLLLSAWVVQDRPCAVEWWPYTEDWWPKQAGYYLEPGENPERCMRRYLHEHTP